MTPAEIAELRRMTQANLACGPVEPNTFDEFTDPFSAYLLALLSAAPALLDAAEAALKPCPHVHTADDGTSHCALAERDGLEREHQQNNIDIMRVEIADLRACLKDCAAGLNLWVARDEMTEDNYSTAMAPVLKARALLGGE